MGPISLGELSLGVNEIVPGMAQAQGAVKRFAFAEGGRGGEGGIVCRMLEENQDEEGEAIV